MIIFEDIYNEILFKTPNPPPEIGGALFQKDGVISLFVSDNGLKEYAKYTPDVDFLNQQIAQLSEEGYEFCGFFHTHFPFGETLSDSDKVYIKKIALSLKKQISTLYFSIVLPNEKMVAYRSCFSNDDVIISDDNLIII